MLLEQQIMTEDWSNDPEIQLYVTGINYILKYIKLLSFWSNNQMMFKLWLKLF